MKLGGTVGDPLGLVDGSVDGFLVVGATVGDVVWSIDSLKDGDVLGRAVGVIILVGLIVVG